MSGFSVDVVGLAELGRELARVGAAVAGTGASLGGLGPAAGPGQVGAALERVDEAWRHGLRVLGEEAARAGEQLSVAARSYALADEQVAGACG